VEAEPYRPVLYRFAMLLASLAAVLSLFALVRRWLGAVGMLAVAGVLVAFTLPGVSGSVVQPTLVVAAGAVVAVLLPERRTLARASVYLLALAVAAIMLGPGVWIGFDIGLNAGPRPVRDRSDETRGENVPRPGPTWLRNKQPSAVVRVPCPAETPVPRDAFINREHSRPKASRWSSPSRAEMVQTGIDEADEPRWRLRPEPGYRAIGGIVGPGPHRRPSRDRRSELFAFSPSGGPLIHRCGELGASLA
jgi:hypothetical protein